MAIYHMHSQAISRSQGRSIVAAMAYRAAEKLHDQRLDITYDYTRKAGVAHSEIMAPDNAPAWMRDRASLWNGADAAEKRRDAQMGREVRVALPDELTREEQIETLRAFVQDNFVNRGMVADFSLHHDNPKNPHAHIVLTTRGLVPDANGEMAFGKKCRAWNDKQLYGTWREGWANHCNHALQRAGHDIRIDHRSYEEQGIALVPTVHIGKDEARAVRDVNGYVTQDRLAEHDRVTRLNGDAIIDNPAIALDAITKQRASFTRSDVGRFLHSRTSDAEQFNRALSAVMGDASVVDLQVRNAAGNQRFTTLQVQAAETRLLEHTAALQQRHHHQVEWGPMMQAGHARGLSDEQHEAMRHVLRSPCIAVVEGYAGTGKSTMLDAAREVWSGSGYHVQGAALSGKAAEGLEQAAGISSRTLASLEKAWERGEDRLNRKSVLVIDEAGMVGTAQMQRVLAAADAARAKVVLVGDTQQLQAIEAGAPMRAMGDMVGRASMQEIRRQQVSWQREASMALARGATRQGLGAYDAHGNVHMCRDQDAAMREMVRAWGRGRQSSDGSQVMLAFRRDEVARLNQLAREQRQRAGELQNEQRVQTHDGAKDFAEGERLYFLRNDRNLGVKNGTLGTVEQVKDGKMVVALDAEGGGRGAARQEAHRVSFDTRQYDAIDYGYAATVHKAQGVTVERAYVLGSELYDRNVTNVALTRHRRSAQMYLSRDMAPDKEAAFALMGKERPKDMVLDYDRVARDNDKMQRETAARMEAQRREREMGQVERRTPRAPTQAEMVEKAQDKEGRDRRIDEFYTLQGKAQAGRRALEDGRTTYEKEFERDFRVKRCRENLDRALQQHDKYANAHADFRRDHPIKAALGWEPQINDAWGNPGPLSKVVARAAEHLRDKQGDWACVRDDARLRQEMQEKVNAQNTRAYAAERDMPGIERALKAAKPQHEHDWQAHLIEREQERARSRELDRGMGFEL